MAGRARGGRGRESAPGPFRRTLLPLTMVSLHDLPPELRGWPCERRLPKGQRVLTPSQRPRLPTPSHWWVSFSAGIWGTQPSVPNTPSALTLCVWPTVGQHRGSAGERLLRRGGEGRQAPAGGHPARLRGLGAESRLPGLHGEPPAGAVPAQSPLLRQPASRPVTPWPSEAGGRGPWHLLAVNSCPRLPALRGYLHALWGQEQAGRWRPDSGSGAKPAWGPLGLALPPLLRFVNHVKLFFLKRCYCVACLLSSL